MAKKNIHPNMKPVTYKFSKGRTLVLKSNYKNSEFLLENDIFLHPAWREDAKVVNSGSAKVSKFNASFGGTSPLGSFSPINLAEEGVIGGEANVADTNTAPKPKRKKKEEAVSDVE